MCLKDTANTSPEMYLLQKSNSYNSITVQYINLHIFGVTYLTDISPMLWNLLAVSPPTHSVYGVFTNFEI